MHVDTGGSSPDELVELKRRALALGAAEHHEIDAKKEVFDRFIRYLIGGNILRGETYPLCVAAERTQQAISVVDVANSIGAAAIAHGSTGAGNDQIRFDVAFRVLAPQLHILTPIRDESVTRDQARAFLEKHNFTIPSQSGQYSINRGLWGTAWGGGWTHNSWEGPPAEFSNLPANVASSELVIGWQKGVPVSLDGKFMDGHLLSEALGLIAERYSIGRNIHLGETVLGIKGRVGFEAGAALILIAAHRELEKLVLSKWQTFWKDQLGRFYGDRLHEGQYFDPALRDIEAMIESSQQRVTGETRLRLDAGRYLVVGVQSPNSMIAGKAALYGEETSLWTGQDARSFAKLLAVSPSLAAQSQAKE